MGGMSAGLTSQKKFVGRHVTVGPIATLPVFGWRGPPTKRRVYRVQRGTLLAFWDSHNLVHDNSCAT